MAGLDEVHRKLLSDRVVAVFEPLTDEVAERTVGQLLYLEEVDAEREITLSLSTPGGSVPAGLAVLQALAQLGPPVSTVCLERCGGIATLLLAAGTRGRRIARQGARISLDRPGSAAAVPGAAGLEQLRARLLALASALTGQPEARLAQDMELELELTAEGAKRYGIVDEVVAPPASQ